MRWSTTCSIAGRTEVYLDQFAVRADYQRQRIGSQLSRQLVRDTAGHLLLGAILHQPIRNEASIRFFTREGFHCIGEVREVDLTWGIYER
jgi:ribosomal protein S18 acetylase RimI-like enzyme